MLFLSLFKKLKIFSCSVNVVLCGVCVLGTSSLFLCLSIYYYYKIILIILLFYTDTDLVSVMEATISVNNWSLFGLKLGVPQYEINNIKQQYHSVRDQQQHILSYWIGTGDASWAGLVEALCSPLVNMKGLARHIAINQLCKCVCRIISCVIAKPSCHLTRCVFS